MNNILSLYNITKFPVLIVSSPRCGSGALGHALEQMYSTVFFNEPNFEPERMQEFLNYAGWHNNYILKIMGSSIPSFPKELQEKFFNRTFFTIKLKRSNLVDQIASHYVANKRNKWHYFSNEINGFADTKIDIDIKDINTSIEWVQDDINIINNLPKADLNFTYEEISSHFPLQVPVVKTPYPTNYDEVFKAVTNRYGAERILIMGLPGSGKTTLAKELAQRLHTIPFNADEVRAKFNDWDFSPEGRIRQSHRMKELCDSNNSRFNIADFVAPLPEMRGIFDAHYTIWMDTISQGRFEDTNKMFVPPSNYNIRITTKNATKWAEVIAAHLLDNLR